MRHRLAIVLTVIGAISLPIVMAATVLYASDAAIGDAGEPFTPHFGTTPPATTETPVTKHHRPPKDHNGSTNTGGGDDHGGSSGGGSSGGGSSGSGSDGTSGGGSSHGGGDDGSSSGGGSSGSGSGHGGDD
jgi:hypothetical protein